MRIAVAAAVVVCVAALVMFATPSSRGGVIGELTQAAREATSAVRSGEAALDAWQRGRSTGDLASVQLTDARDDVVEASSTVAELDMTNAADAQRRRDVSGQMNSAVDLLVTAHGLVAHGLPATPDLVDALHSAAESLAGYGS